jgi:general secretion pathway protein I
MPAAHRRPAGPAPGFTLLEVMVALGLLAAALMAISDLAGNALRNHAYARDLSLATLLARGKMAEVEEKYEDSGFKDFDEEQDGDFEEQGHKEVKWLLQVRKPESSLSAEQLLGILAGTGGGSTQEILAKLMGSAPAPGGGPKTDLGPASAALAAMLQTQLTAFGEGIKKSLREARLTVAWRDGKATRKLSVVTHLVVLNPKAPGGQRGTQPDVPPNLAAAPAGAPGAAGVPGALPGTPLVPAAPSPPGQLPWTRNRR